MKNTDPPDFGPTWFDTDQERVPEDEVLCTRCGRIIAGEPAISSTGPPERLCTACAEADG